MSQQAVDKLNSERSWAASKTSLLLIVYLVTILLGCIDAPPQPPGHNNPWDSENPSTPQAPKRLRAHAVSETAVFIQWHDQSGNEDGFRIFESIESEREIHLIDTTEPNVESLIVSDRQVLTDYSYYIEAFNAKGASFKQQVCASTKAAPPNAPDSLIIAIAAPGSINIQWRDNSFIEESFELEEAIGNPVKFRHRVSTPTDCTAATVDSLPSNITFWYRVAGRNENGISKYTDPESVRIN